jgi:hypothetical protein
MTDQQRPREKSRELVMGGSRVISKKEPAKPKASEKEKED